MHVRSHKKVYKCEYCPRFSNEKKAKVVQHEKQHHAELLNLNTDETGYVNQAVEQLFPDALFAGSQTEPLNSAGSTQMYSAAAEMSPVGATATPYSSQDYVGTSSTAEPPISSVNAQAPIPATLREMPPSRTHTGDQVASARVAASRDTSLARLWEKPSLLISGITYRKVTERVILSDGTTYESVVEELEKPEEEQEQKSKRRKSHKHSH